MMGLSDGRKSFHIGLVVLIQYRSVTASQPPTQPPSESRCRSYYRAYCVAQVKSNNNGDGENGVSSTVSAILTLTWTPMAWRTALLILTQQLLQYFSEQ